MFRRGTTIVLVSMLAACADQPVGPTGPEVQIQVAPLELPGVGDACYTLEVTNAGDQPVWRQEHVCANSYGDGRGGIAYVGPCDADDGDDETPAQATNRVHLVLEGLEDVGGAPITDFVNPCVDADDCVRDIVCVENQDAQAAFDITIMRGAGQGFFDIGVSFEDLFCSAKIDCEYASGEPIHLLFDPDTGKRASTVVLAFACTAGAAASESTTLHASDVVVTCPGQADVIVDPASGVGNLYDDDAPSPLFQAQVSMGAEALQDGASGGNAHKLYWTVALGVDTAALAALTGTCNVSARLTASNGGDETWATPGTVYPEIGVSLPLTFGGTPRELTCGRHGLDDDSVISTGYLPGGATFTNCLESAGDDAAFCPEPASPHLYSLRLGAFTLQRWDTVANTLTNVGPGAGFNNARDGAWLDGSYYVLNAAGRLFRVDVTSGLGSEIAVGADGLGLGAGPDGKLYSLNTGTFPIQILQRWDPLLGTYELVGSGTGFNNTRDATFDAAGNYWMLGSNGKLVRIDLTTGVGSEIASGNDGIGIAAGADGFFYSVTTSGSNGILQRWDPLNGTHTLVGSGTGFGNTRDAAIDAHGDFYLLTAIGSLVRVDLTTGVGTAVVVGNDGIALVAPR